MRWLIRFLAWATPLTWLATAFYAPYLRFLCAVAIGILGGLGVQVHLQRADVLAPIDLALFIALAMSLGGVRWPSRIARLAIGLVVLLVIEIVIVSSGILLFLIMGLPADRGLGLLFENAVSLIGWAAAPALWVALFRPRPLLDAIARRGAPTAPRLGGGEALGAARAGRRP